MGVERLLRSGWGMLSIQKKFYGGSTSRCRNIDLSSKNFVCVSVTFQLQEFFEGNVIDLIFIKLGRNILLGDAYSKFENFESFMRALNITQNSIFHKILVQSLH